MAIEVGLLLELLDVVAIGARVHLPVDGRDVVAGHVLAVLGELDAKALEGTAMQAGEKALDDRPGPELQRPEARHDRRIQELAFARTDVHGYIPLAGTGTVWRRRSMMASELMRSDSA